MEIPDAIVGFLLGILVVGILWLSHHQLKTKKECPKCEGSGFVERN